MKERKFIIIAVIVAFVAVLLLGGYFLWRTGARVPDVREEKELLPVYDEYTETEVAVATIRYTRTGFERDSFTLVSPEKGVIVVINDDPERAMQLEIAEGPGVGYPKALPSVQPGEYTEAQLPEPGHYVIRDTASPENVYFTVDLYATLEEANAGLN